VKRQEMCRKLTANNVLGLTGEAEHAVTSAGVGWCHACRM